MGREDIDVRCLGGGRPFVMELKQSRKSQSDAEAKASAEQRSAREFVGLAKAENAQLRRLNEELSAELQAATKATEAASLAAEDKAHAGAEMVRLANEENVKLREVNAQVIAALKNANVKASKSAKAASAAPVDTSNNGGLNFV